MGTDERRRAVDRLSQSLFYLARKLGARPAKPSMEGLSLPQSVVVGWLALGGKRRITEVAERLGVSMSAATGLADRLVRAGLAVRERSLEDRRVVWLDITEKGRKLLARNRDLHRDRVESVFEVLDDHELEEVIRLINKVVSRS